MTRKTLATLLLALLAATTLSSCSQEQQNKIGRLGVTWLEGDYKVTFTEGNFQKSWTVIDGKVTSEPAKGYYYFWATENGRKIYVQTPIIRTYIEELRQ
jgi:hypothetical protein